MPQDVVDVVKQRGGDALGVLGRGHLRQKLGVDGVGKTEGIFAGVQILSAAQELALKAGDLYFNLHTAAAPGGEIRGQITVPVPAAAARPPFERIAVYQRMIWEVKEAILADTTEEFQRVLDEELLPLQRGPALVRALAKLLSEPR